jgi:GxxExxY protein
MIHQYAEHVYKVLGPGFSERIYHNALEVVLRKNGVRYETERIVPIVFEEHTIGNLRADLILNNKTVLELKSVKTVNDVMVTQAQNYLKLTIHHVHNRNHLVDLFPFAFGFFVILFRVFKPLFYNFVYLFCVEPDFF